LGVFTVNLWVKNDLIFYFRRRGMLKSNVLSNNPIWGLGFCAKDVAKYWNATSNYKVVQLVLIILVDDRVRFL
jgi:hypothetical protein